MEIFLGATLLAGIVLAAVKFASSDPDTPTHSQGRAAKVVSLERSHNPAISSPQPRRFDEKSAKHLDRVRVVSGAAYVTDGDTIRINKLQIRLFGIDAPELNHPYGKAAKWALVRLCKGQCVRAEITEEDKFGRTVARCYLPDGRDLSAEMVKMGLAIDWKKFSGGCYRAMETPDARRNLFLADARQKGRMDVWAKFEARAQKQ